MNLPIDPSVLGDEDIGQKQTTLKMDHEDAVEYVRETFKDAGFGIPIEFSVSEILEKKGINRDPYYVIGACSPKMADKALTESNKKIGSLFPCNVVIWEEESGSQRIFQISIMKVARLLGISPDNREWEKIVQETSKLTEKAWKNLKSDKD